MTDLLNRRLTLEEAQRVSDGAGGFVEEWVGLGSLWTNIRAGTGRRGGNDLVTSSEVPYRITVRGASIGAPSRPRAGQRLRYGERLFRIEAVAEADPAGSYLICFAREEVAT